MKHLSKPEDISVILPDRIARSILLIRGQKVIIDADLAEFYGVSTRRLNEQIKRNRDRFPADFVFRLSPAEKSEVVAKCDHLSRLKFSRTLPQAFTEHGALMAASVLNSPRAVQVSLLIVRAFVALRRAVVNYREISEKVAQLEKKLANHDKQITLLFRALRDLLSPALPPEKRRIGFRGNRS